MEFAQVFNEIRKDGRVDRDEAEELLRTLFTDPEVARFRAEQELVPDPDPAIASIGHQVVGIVLRDRGETDAALRVLRTSVRSARRSADEHRVADARATLGGTLATAGRVREGLGHLDAAAGVLDGVPLGRVLVRRAWVSSYLLSRFEDGADDLARASHIFDGAGDTVWEARALHLNGITRMGLGDLVGARRAFRQARALWEEVDHGWDVAASVHAEGWVDFLEGDLPRALEQLADAAARFEALDITSVELLTDQCAVYLAGGLAQDALAVVHEALSSRPLQARERSDVLCAEATAALAAGDLPRAAAAADDARRLYRAPGHEVDELRAELLALTARADAGQPAGRLLPRVEALVESSRRTGDRDLPRVLLLGARVARSSRATRAPALSDAWLGEAASFRHASTASTRALGWLALAQKRHLAGEVGGVLRACDRGLAALADHATTLGSQELRASVSGHGAQLAALGTRTALTSGDPRRMLRWSERWRATSLATAVPRNTRDHETSTELAALRALHHRLAEGTVSGDAAEHLRARVARLEQSVRHRLLRTRGEGATSSSLDVSELLESLAEDDTVLVELTEIDGVLHALVAGRGRVRHLVVGDAAAGAAAVDFSLFTLRQAARGRRSQLDVAGARLERSLLGAALDGVGESRVVVSGTSALQGVPWGLLPSLTHRPVTSTPSARLWLRARAAAPAEERRVLLVGPGLGSGGAEVPAVAAQDPEAEVLDGESATVAAALTALDGASLAHVAAHGHFREDSPLFSSLTLADGPLLVHDLQRLERPPHRVVLSACESGVMAPVGDQELLGLAAALLSMGTAGVVSSLAEVDDAATVEVMVALHARLRSGGGLGDALLAARDVAAGDPVLAATAASFTVLGT